MLASDLVNLVGRWNKQADEAEQKELSVRRGLGRGVCKTADSLQGEVRALRQAADELWQELEKG